MIIVQTPAGYISYWAGGDVSHYFTVFGVKWQITLTPSDTWIFASEICSTVFFITYLSIFCRVLQCPIHCDHFFFFFLKTRMWIIKVKWCFGSYDLYFFQQNNVTQRKILGLNDKSKCMHKMRVPTSICTSMFAKKVHALCMCVVHIPYLFN